jgi:citrate lyase subunit beta/citryl-CoA lyase
VALAFGAEDYTASMEIDRTKTGEELFHARTMVAWAAKAAGLQVIDSIFPDANDMDGLRAETELVKRLGYTGKSLVNPRQIEVVHEVFRPKPEEVAHALEVMEAIQRAREMGTGVISLRGRMVDAPVVKRAARTIKTAVAFGMIEYELTDEVIHGAK